MARGVTAAPGTGAALAVAVAAAAVGSCGRSYRRFDWRTAEDERHRVRTADGWNLALYRYRPAAARYSYPVVCGHGMAGTRILFDLHPDYSLARHLAAAGFDVWLVDLRGRCASWPDGGPRRELQWSFDDFAARDLPAAVSSPAGSARGAWRAATARSCTRSGSAK